jgi:hypothetical protein
MILSRNKESPVCAVVKFSELARWGRWDAEFHILRDAYGKQADDLQSTHTEREIRRMARRLPLDSKTVKSLRRSQRAMSASIRELASFPLDYVCLYVVVATSRKHLLLGQSIKRLERQAKQLRLKAAAITKIAKSIRKQLDPREQEEDDAFE